MKQPALGKKIAELRKSRGMTQEELVDRCNISVRTIQRIETGEVTPRSYTVRSILDALDYDLGSIANEKEGQSLKWLQYGMIAGIIYFVLGFPESIMEGFRFAEEGNMMFGDFGSFGSDMSIGLNTTWYVVVKALSLISVLIFMNGFVITGKRLGDNMLVPVVYIMMVFLTTVMLYDIVSMFYDAHERTLLIPVISVCYGLIAIVFGVALIRLNKSLGVLCLLAGIFEIISGFFFVLVTPIGDFFLVPAEIFEIIILYRAFLLFTSEPGERGEDNGWFNGLRNSVFTQRRGES